MEAGLYVTFFSSGEPAERELPAVGPLYNVVLRHKSLVAERRTVMQAQELGVAIDRWLEAELEMQRATGEEPGGTKRTAKRVFARDGVYLRFAVFGEAHEPDIAAELGPYAAVIVGPRTVEADGRTLATRAASDLAPWQLASGAGEDLDGKHKPDIAFRTANTSYHPAISGSGAPRPAQAPAVTSTAPPAASPPRSVPSEPAFAIPPRSQPVFSPAPNAEPFFTPPARTEQVIRTGPRPDPAVPPSENGAVFQERPRRQTEIYSARAEASPSAPDENLTPGDVELIARINRERSDESLRARIHEGERKRLGIDEQANAEVTSVSMRYRAQAEAEPYEESESRFEWGPALWRMRFAIIGVLLLLVGAYTFIVLRTGGALALGGSQPQGSHVVNIGQRFTAPGWEFAADGVTRVEVAGSIRARGVFLIVRLSAANKSPGASELVLSGFTLVDQRGARYAPEAFSTGVYQGGPNGGTTYVLGDPLASGRSVALTLVFDVDPSLIRGLTLQITEAPDVTVKLD